MRRVALVAVLATAVAYGSAQTSGAASLENLYYDLWHVLQGVRYQPQHTAIVMVDDATLVALKDDPLAFWAPHWGRAMDVLTRAGVKVTGFDFIQQVSAEGWLKKLDVPGSEASRTYDAPLRAALAQGDKILITHLVELPDGELTLLAPPEEQRLLLPGGSNDLGIANLYPDPDKHVRHFYPVLLADPSLPGVGLDLQLALRAAGADPRQSEWRLAGRTIAREPRALPIGYAGPAGTVPSISMLALLQPDALEEPEVRALKGKVVILSVDNTGSPDRHFTPYSRGARSEQMSGGEIHANIVETLLSGRYPAPLAPAAAIGYVALAVALAAYFFFALPVAAGAAAAAGLCLLLAGAAYAAFRFEHVLPVAQPQLGVLAAFLMTLGLRLTGEERERVRIRQMFGRYVSDEVVDKLLSEPQRPDLGGEVLEVTVLFSDIRGFTTLSEKLDAHEVVEMLNAYFTRVCEPILAQGGTVDKYIGDAVMAVFGSPVRHSDHALRGVRAAVGMAREADTFRHWMRERFPDRGLADFAIGVGLHSGTAVIGDIGTPRRKEFTAIGDTVNAASRLEGASKDLGCVIVASEATVRAAGAGVRTGKQETIRVKGKSEPIRVFEITGAHEG